VIYARLGGFLFLAWLGLMLGGCFLASTPVEAAYKIPKEVRVLVLVDPVAGSHAPAVLPVQLGQAITDQLFRMKAADQFVAQFRIERLREEAGFAKYTIAEIAEKTEADYVLVVDVTLWKVEVSAGGEIVTGRAETSVRMVNRAGERVYPTGNSENAISGLPIIIEAPNQPIERVNAVKMQDLLIRNIAIQASKSFHKWDSSDASFRVKF